MNQVTIDPTLTLDSAAASLAAYADFENKPVIAPTGYMPVARFTGWDEVFHITGEEERFGLIFRSLTDPTQYMIAFRGTASILDAYEDIWATTRIFQPYANGSAFPRDVTVASGFDSIYSDKGGSMGASMQRQIFTFLANVKPAPKKIAITGHSLGGALASLFTLDAAVSRPDLQITSMTFASPRVGTSEWQNVYQNKYGLNSRTYRIANYYDLVPSLPPTAFGYEHIGQQFLLAFYVENAWVPHYLSRHALLNYQTVLARAVYDKPQIWTGVFDDATSPGRKMLSVAPPSSEVPAWVDMTRAAEEAALASPRQSA
jgi:hypothetical protein